MQETPGRARLPRPGVSLSNQARTVPKVRKKLPHILSQEEVARLIEASSSLFQRMLLMVLYGTGMRRPEIAQLKIADIDSQRMVIHVVNGKGGKDRDLPLSPALLETLRVYWRWMKPRTYLFPSRTYRDYERPITGKAVWNNCTQAARRAGIRKRVTPHLIRHSWATHLLEVDGGASVLLHARPRLLSASRTDENRCGQSRNRRAALLGVEGGLANR